jgi:hypothetical protein
MGAYSLSEATFLHEYGDEDMGWGQGYLHIADQYAEIVMNSEQLDAYRVNRREGRGRAVAMGDSLGGLAKGYVMAAGVNLAVGALHRTFNGLGKIINAIGDSMKKSRIFNDPETKATLCADMYRAVFLLHYAFIDAANEVLGANISGMDEDHEVQEGLGLLSNIQKGRLPAERVPELLGRCLTLAPYNKEIYDFILLQYGDPTGSLERAAAYFGIDMGAAKERLIEQQGEAVLESNESWEARAQKLMALRKLTGTAEHSRLLHYRQALAERAVGAFLEDDALAQDQRIAKLKALCDDLGFAEGHAFREELLSRLTAAAEAALLEAVQALNANDTLNAEQRRAELKATAKRMGLAGTGAFQKADACLKLHEKARELCASDMAHDARVRALREAATQLGAPQKGENFRKAVLLLEVADVKERTVDGKEFASKEAAQSQAKMNKGIKIAAAVGIVGFFAWDYLTREPETQAAPTATVTTPTAESAIPTPEALAPLPLPEDGSAVPVTTPSGIRDSADRIEVQDLHLEAMDGELMLRGTFFNPAADGTVGEVKMRVAFYDEQSSRLGVEDYEGHVGLRSGISMGFHQRVPFPSATRFEIVELTAINAE